MDDTQDHPRACGEQPHLLVVGRVENGSSPRMRGAGGGHVQRPHQRRIIPAHAGSRVCLHRLRHARWDHPRACGEQGSFLMPSMQSSGSSPRMRGAAIRNSRELTWQRIIPAHAGSSSPRGRLWCRPPDHPRACGEQGDVAYGDRSMSGSSPRMRGAGVADSRAAFPDRIIPAHAGSSRHRRRRTRSTSDHPRACGEQDWPSYPTTAAWGSSPRMRGAACLQASVRGTRRIIPAHAGSSRAGQRKEVGGADHPRACGEQPPCLAREIAHVGSSPRMRGADDCSWVGNSKPRIIPAHAGSSTCARGRSSWREDHPRACGEQWQRWGASTSELGSSPRMRGAGVARRPEVDVARIIPAHAGSSRAWRPDVCPGPDHPRACGEQLMMDDAPSDAIGSSPRMRGAGVAVAGVAVAGGIIPAHAGSRCAHGLSPSHRADHPRACGEQ